MRRRAHAAVNGASNTCGPGERSTKAVSVVDSVGAIAFLEGVALNGIGAFEVEDMPCQGSFTHEFADVRLDLPNGPAVHVSRSSSDVVHLATRGRPSRSRRSLGEVEVHLELCVDVVDVSNGSLKSGDVLGVDRPRQTICSFVEVVGRGEARRGEVTDLKAAERCGESHRPLRRAAGGASCGVFENARPIPFGAVRIERWKIRQGLQGVTL